MKFHGCLPAVVLLATGTLVHRVSGATILKTIPVFRECGEKIDGTCIEGTKCSPGVPSFCLPLSDYRTNTTSLIKEVQGYGGPIPDTTNAANEDQISVFIVCTDLNFSGNCVEIQLGPSCDFCGTFNSTWQYVISSIRIVDNRVTCNFWVTTNCVGDGIAIPFLNPIFDLSATNYNDRIVAFNCFFPVL